MKYYAESHEWVEIVDGIATVGISEFAAEELGDLTYVELPAIGAVFAAGAVFGSVESVKAASDIYAPLAGKVCEVNDALTTTPEVLNEAAEGEGWICRFSDVDQSGLSRLMSREDYLKSIGK